MGCLNAKPVQTSEPTKKNPTDKKEKTTLKEVKVVFLGAGETGKSTMSRQIRYILGKQFSQDEMMACREPIFENILLTTRGAIREIIKMEKENFFENEKSKVRCKYTKI